MPLFFDSRNLPGPTTEYVAWVDIMGTQSAMSRSIDATANFVFKLHTAVIQSNTMGIDIYPVMDGFYASSPSQSNILDFLRSVFLLVADEFIQTSLPLHKFIIRGGLAFGPVIHGRSINAQSSPALANNPAYRDSILLGMPMVQSHLCERSAPPFGIFVHESARSFAPPGLAPIHFTWWKWANNSNQTWRTLKRSLNQHYTWCSRRSMALEYSIERIKAHKEMIDQYFAL